jgi:nucleolar MIF4G domain-containing protein 1
LTNLDTGFQLRSDDPAALKDIILLVKEKAASAGVNVETPTKTAETEAEQFNLRVKFMLQTIFDLKNNKRKASDDDSVMQQTKKTIKNILGKKSK